MAKDILADFFNEKRDWSEVKDALLGNYIRPYLSKVLLTYRPICYVDCFAGVGKFGDGKDGSPLIVLKAREECLSKTKIVNPKIETYFIELNYVDELKKNIGTQYLKDGKQEVIKGKYEEVIRGILQGRREQNVFLYIDPYGIKSLDFALFEEFQTYKFRTFEMLINFNSFGFFRNACRAMDVEISPEKEEEFQELEDLFEYDLVRQDIEDLANHAPKDASEPNQLSELLSRIAGGTYWKKIVEDYRNGKINGIQAEERFSAEYKQRLMRIFKYVLDMPIRLESGRKPKYRMIHVSNHEGGCLLMAENMQRREKEKEQKEKQLCMYDLLGYLRSVGGDHTTKEVVEENVRKLLYTLPCGITEFLARFFTENGVICESDAICAILKEMERAGEIDTIRFPATTKTGRKSNFWKEEHGNKLRLIRNLA